MAKNTDFGVDLLRNAVGTKPKHQEELEKSIYSLQLEQNGAMEQIGMGCAVEMRHEGGEKEYHILTSNLIVSRETCAKLTCYRYRGSSSRIRKDYHEIELTDPHKCLMKNLKPKGFSFLHLSKVPKWYCTLHLERNWYERENKPSLTCHTFCKKKPVQLKFDFLDGQYKISGTPEEAGASGKVDLIGAPLFIKENFDGVVGVVGKCHNGEELCPILFCERCLGEEDVEDSVEKQKTEERELPNESQNVHQEDIKDSVKTQECQCELPDQEPKNIYGHDKEVKAVVEELACNTTPVVIVHGGAGYGKTTAAVQASYQMCKRSNTVLFCTLRGFCDSEEDVYRALLSICTSGKSTMENPRFELLNWCRRLDHEIVLVLDNAEDALEDHNKDSFITLIEEMWKCSKKKIKFLITSRRADIFISNLSVKPIEIDVLEPEESFEMLKYYSNLQASAETTKLKTVAEKCGHIPLALRLAGSLLSRDSLYTVDELIHDLAKSPTTTLRVEQMFTIAFERLDQKRRDALVKLTVFVGSFSKDTAKALLGGDCTELLNDLKGRSLIQSESELHSRYSLHLLMRDYACKMGKKDEFTSVISDAKNAFSGHFLSYILSRTEEFFSKDCCKASTDAFNKERLNLECCLKDVRNCEALDEVLKKCRIIAPYIEYCIPFRLYFDFLTRLLDVSREKEQKVHEVEILCLLAHESRKHGNEQQLRDYMELAIKNHEEQKECFQQNIDSEVFYLYHYGRHLHQDCCNKENASKVLNNAVDICKENNRDSHPDFPRILSQEGHNLKIQKLEEEAHKRFSQALDLRQKFYGCHLLTAFACKDFADNYLFFDKYGNAERLYEEAIDILKKVEMFEQKEAIPVLKNFAICSEKQENFQKARGLYEQGKVIAENTIEGSHKWKIWLNTYLAILIFEKYTDEVQVAIEIAAEVFRMSKDLKMEDINWPKKEQLLKLYGN